VSKEVLKSFISKCGSKYNSLATYSRRCAFLPDPEIIPLVLALWGDRDEKKREVLKEIEIEWRKRAGVSSKYARLHCKITGEKFENVFVPGAKEVKKAKKEKEKLRRRNIYKNTIEMAKEKPNNEKEIEAIRKKLNLTMELMMGWWEEFTSKERIAIAKIDVDRFPRDSWGEIGVRNATNFRAKFRDVRFVYIDADADRLKKLLVSEGFNRR
jgi:hypothetical protein